MFVARGERTCLRICLRIDEYAALLIGLRPWLADAQGRSHIRGDALTPAQTLSVRKVAGRVYGGKHVSPEMDALTGRNSPIEI